MESDKSGHRYVSWFLSKEGQQGTQIRARLQAVCGQGAPSLRTVQRWVEQFQDGKNDTDNGPRSGRPRTATTEATIDRVKQLIEEDPTITTREVEAAVGISKLSIDHILHEDLGLSKLTARCLPRTQ